MEGKKWIIAWTRAIREDEIKSIEINTSDSDIGYKYYAQIRLHNDETFLLCGDNIREELDEKLKKILNE